MAMYDMWDEIAWWGFALTGFITPTPFVGWVSGEGV